MAMARVMVLMALCVLPALVSATRPLARPTVSPLTVTGKVYCDTCQAGFETTATTYMPGAVVKVECKKRETLELIYKKEGVTDATGTYNIEVSEDHADELCDAFLVKSSDESCKTASPGRDGARVILTSSNGIVSTQRFANAMGFMKDKPLDNCAQVLQQYQELDD